jgi:hypothetical protein
VNLTLLVPKRKSIQTPGMPLPARIIVTIVSLGSIAFLTFQIRDLLRRKRNLKHFERDEPLEKAGDWD